MAELLWGLRGCSEPLEGHTELLEVCLELLEVCLELPAAPLFPTGPVRCLLLLHLQPAAAALVQPGQLEVPVGTAGVTAALSPPEMGRVPS